MGRNYDVKAYMSSTLLKEGDVITGADVNNVYVQNRRAKYAPAMGSGPEGQVYGWNGSAYAAALDSSRGDGFFFGTPNANRPDRIRVVRAPRDRSLVELAAEWDAWDLDTGYLGTPGIGYRDWVGGGGLNYAQSTASPPKYITDVRVVKTAIMLRGAEGVYLGAHSDPRVGPLGSQTSTRQNSTDWGEREFQLGVGIRAIFASTGESALHPDWGADARWGGAGVYPTIRHWWPGIDDADYPPYDAGAYVALQPSGFPAEQTDGPWWIGALHNLNGSTYPFCAYMVLRERMEFGSFQFSAGAYGQPTLHFANEAHDGANVPYRTMCFIGAFPYSSASLAAEPTGALRTVVAARAAEVTAAWSRMAA